MAPSTPFRSDSFRPDSLTSDTSQKQELRARLLYVPFGAFVRCLADLLDALGYVDVRPAGRTQWKGRNQAGGCDIEAGLPSGLGHRRVVVQVKQFTPKQRVYQRAVDELRGVALREWAGEALLLTTGPVSSAIREPVGVLVPVRLLGDGALLDALIANGVGVRTENGRWFVNGAYFDRLTAECRAGRPGDQRTDRQRTDRKAEKAPRPSAPAGTLTFTMTLPLSLAAAGRESARSRAKS